ncbi:MAG: helix-turn-helix domain-containing protein [Clostridia bacterium]|nr:helix-turn-helix domain-containing protein [Clostridia bacterium]
MAIYFKVNVLAALADAGYSQNKIRREKLLGQATLTKLRGGGLPSWHELDIICGLLDCQPGDLLEYVMGDEPVQDNARLPHVFQSIQAYSGAALYALVDENGKKYIGSTNDFQRRVKAWETHLRRIAKQGEGDGFVPAKLSKAFLAGVTFSAVVLEKLPSTVGFMERVQKERAAILECGGLDCTYNSILPRLQPGDLVEYVPDDQSQE